jgi:hypothetical protein
MKTYKIVKKWADYPFNNWFWYAYEKDYFLGIPYWTRIPEVCEWDYSKAERVLKEYVDKLKNIESLKKEESEEVIIEL